MLHLIMPESHSDQRNAAAITVNGWCEARGDMHLLGRASTGSALWHSREQMESDEVRANWDIIAISAEMPEAVELAIKIATDYPSNQVLFLSTNNRPTPPTLPNLAVCPLR